MINKKINTVFFDLDGTLLDTAPDLTFAINHVLKNYGKTEVDFNEFRFHIHGGSKSMIQFGFGIDEYHPEFSIIKQKCLQHYSENIANQTQFFEGIEEVLNYIEKNKLIWGIVTNKPMWLTKPLLDYFNLSNRAKCIVGHESVAKQKPDPAPLLYACELVNQIPQNAVYVGDTETDIIAAKAAGMQAIAALYGYKPKVSNPADWQADYFIQSPIEILDWLNHHSQISSL